MNKKTQIFTRWQDPTVDEYKDALENAGTEIILLRDKNRYLKSIIKEAREYIKEHICNDMKYPDYMEITKKEYYKLLEILDKENK